MHNLKGPHIPWFIHVSIIIIDYLQVAYKEVPNRPIVFLQLEL